MKTPPTIKIALALLGFLGFLCSLFVHILSLLKMNPEEYIPFAWFLHIGIFVVFAPAIFIMKEMYGTTRLDIRDFPLKYNIILFPMMLYTGINFFSSFKDNTRNVSYKNGTYLYKERGGESKVHIITKKEYDAEKAKTFRGFSGHWMLFYLAATFMLMMKPEDIGRKVNDKNNSTKLNGI